MTRMIVGRLFALVPTLFLATFGIFILVKLAPGDPAIALAGETATAEQIERVRQQHGLDRPILVQFIDWLSNAVRGDLGNSVTNGMSVTDQLQRTLPITIQLVAGALLVAIVLGVGAGLAAARRAYTNYDAVIVSAATTGASIPSFWLGLILISIFALGLGWLPATGYVGFGKNPELALKQLILPSIALGVAGAAEIARQLRSAMLDVLGSDHVRTLRAKGLSDGKILWKHALKGAGVPIVTIIGLQVSTLLGSTVVVEAAFGIGGMGSLVAHAAQNRDFPIVQGVVVVMVILVLLVNFLVDVSYRVLDPRTR